MENQISVLQLLGLCLIIGLSFWFGRKIPTPFKKATVSIIRGLLLVAVLIVSLTVAAPLKADAVQIKPFLLFCFPLLLAYFYFWGDSTTKFNLYSKGKE